MIRKLICGAGALGTSLFAATAAFAQEATASAAAAVASAAPSPEATASAAAAATPALIKAPTVAQMATMVNKGDTTWMLV
jgi:Amt family ammonium transporter